ncbi:hypothetical protein D3C73_759230 [compost metagenome]
MHPDPVELDQRLRLGRRIDADKAIRVRNRTDQLFRIGRRRPGEHFADKTALDDDALVQHRNLVHHAGNQPEIVRDVKCGNIRLVAQLVEQVEDLSCGQNVERRGRLVENDQFRLAGKGGGDHHTLLFPARCLMRKPLQHFLRPGNAGAGQRRFGFSPGLRLGQAAMTHQHFGNLLAQTNGRVE